MDWEGLFHYSNSKRLQIYYIYKESSRKTWFLLVSLGWTVGITRTDVTRPGGWGRGTLIGSSSESGGGTAPVSRRWGNHSILGKSVSAQWALLRTKTLPKIFSFWPENSGFDPVICGIESQRTSNELLSDFAKRTVKMQP